MTPRVFLFCLLLLGAAGCSRGPLIPTYALLPEFQLTDQTGAPFGSKELKGKVWVANFIFSTCAGPCPRMSSQFRALQKQTGEPEGLQFVSFTIDPARDTPAVLAAYGKRFGADSARWRFLTGPVAELNKLAAGPFYAGEIDGSLTHSTRFTLVDKTGRIRGFYDSSDTEMTRQLVADIQTVLKEGS